MNEQQKLRLDILRACNFNIEEAQKCIDFIHDGNTVYKSDLSPECLSDGIYYIYDNDLVERFDGNNPPSTTMICKYKVKYIGVVQGNHSVAIALQDVSKSKISLTFRNSDKDHGSYKDNYEDAVHDWDGASNTMLLNHIGLNSSIQRKDGEYIPTLAELYLICFNLKTINAAIYFVGGQILASWYWSSTEYSSTDAWSLNLNDGTASYITKRLYTFNVRLVKKFL